jgi:glycine/sarcosine N-methyltransferase
MIPMINHTVQSLCDVSRFYDELAPDYDAMTNFEKRFVQEKPFFRLLIDRYQIASALDAGCGTGFHSILLAQLGVDVTAADISEEMIRRTETNAKALGIRLQTVRSSFQDLPSHLKRKFNAVFCLGNSLVHLMNREEVEITLENFSSLLKPGGILFIQILNYERILKERKNIQNVSETKDMSITREYEYEEKTIRFTIRKVRQNGNVKLEKTDTLRIMPLVRTDIMPGLSSAGLDDVNTYGSISMIDFVPATVKDLVILARKKA